MIRTSDIDGWIIAGGTSSRMGEDKAALEIGGRKLIQIAALALSNICEGRISIAGSPRDFASQFPTFPDRPAQGLGPISGIETALSNGSTEWIAVISCDMPFVTGEVFNLLVHHARPDDDAVVPVQLDWRPQPLCALYRRESVLTAVREVMDPMDRSLRNLLSRLATHYVPYSAFCDLPNADHLFFNINTPADYERAKGVIQNSGL
jgi:molybdenum cofactor guanylyltransferase